MRAWRRKTCSCHRTQTSLGRHRLPGEQGELQTIDPIVLVGKFLVGVVQFFLEGADLVGEIADHGEPGIVGNNGLRPSS